MLYGLYSSMTEKDDLINNSENTIGIITKIEHRTSRGYFIEYDYVINGRKYYGTQKLTIEKELIKTGDTFKVKYSTKKPDYSKLIIKEKIETQN